MTSSQRMQEHEENLLSSAGNKPLSKLNKSYIPCEVFSGKTAHVKQIPLHMFTEWPGNSDVRVHATPILRMSVNFYLHPQFPRNHIDRARVRCATMKMTSNDPIWSIWPNPFPWPTLAMTPGQLWFLLRFLSPEKNHPTFSRFRPKRLMSPFSFTSWSVNMSTVKGKFGKIQPGTSCKLHVSSKISTKVTKWWEVSIASW